MAVWHDVSSFVTRSRKGVFALLGKRVDREKISTREGLLTHAQ
jgi:hypothetical protein